MSEKMSADPHAYLMWPRLIVNDICGALAIAATALISRSLVNFHHSQHALAAAIPGAQLHGNNSIAVSALMTTASGICALYTGLLSTLIVLKLQRAETRTTILVKEICMGMMAIFLIGTAIAASIVIVPRSTGVSGPLPAAMLVEIINSTGQSLKYRDTLSYDGLIVVWVLSVFALTAFILAALTSRHIQKYGPENAIGSHKVSDEVERNEDGRDGQVQPKTTTSG